MEQVHFGRRVVIYTRYSSTRQDRESCAQQERKVREGLKRMGVDPSDAVVLADEAMKGKREDRKGFLRLKEMIRAGQVSVLGVDQQCRISRGHKVVAFLEDCIFSRTRVLIIGDSIDTEDPNWEISSSVRQMTNSMANRDLAWRVRRAQERRLVDEDCISLGDHPFGFATEYVDADWMDQLRAGRKARKRVVIHEEEAKTVRMIFDLYVNRKLSLSQIAREMNGLKRKKSHRAKGAPWQACHVAFILDCEKYTGRWRWGRIEGVCDSAGRRRRQAAPKEKQVETVRSSLRIIDDELWHKCRVLRVASAERWKTHFWNRKNGAGKNRWHPRDSAPLHNLSGLLRCGSCGARIRYANEGGHFKSFFCPNRHSGGCSMARTINVNTLNKDFYAFLADFCEKDPDWLDQVYSKFRESVQRNAQQAPAARQAIDAEISDLDRKINNVVTALTHLGGDSVALASQLKQLEQQRAGAEQHRLQLRECPTPVSLPDKNTIRNRLRTLPQLLAVPSAETASCLRTMFPVALVEEVHPGQKFGPVRLRLQINPYEVLGVGMGDHWRQRLGLVLPEACFTRQDEHPWVEIEVARPTRYREQGAMIASLRDQGVPWKVIGDQIGLTEGAAYSILSRWRKHQAA